jgi:hypothetical protein
MSPRQRGKERRRDIVRIKQLVFGALAAVLWMSVEAYPQTFENIRTVGMGGAYTAVADDEAALVYNPAGLAFIKGGIAISTFVKSDKKFLDFASDEDVRNGKFSTRLSKYSPLLLDGYSAAAVYGTGFGIGAFGAGSGTFILEGEEAGPDAGIFGEGSGKGELVLGMGFQVIENVLALGACFKAKGAGRSHAFKNYGELAKMDDVMNMVVENSQRGYNYDVDAGAMLRIGSVLSIGAFAHDLLQRSVEVKDEEGNVLETIPYERVVNVGAAIKVPDIPGISTLIKELVIAGDMHNVLGKESERTLAVGADAKILNISKSLHLNARAGLSKTGDSKTYTVGLGLKFLILGLDIALATSKDILVELPEFNLSSLEETVNSYYIGMSISL